MNVFVDPEGPGRAPAGVPAVSTVAAALALAPADGTKPFVIVLAPGTYREKLTIDRPHVHLKGPARIVWGDWAGAPDTEGKPLGTFRTQTLEILAPDFRAEDLVLANDWDYPALHHLPGTQAVAVKADGASDRAVFVRCRLEGYQDTLYANAGRLWFQDCRIEGHVDFIFGAARAVFDRCEIVCLDRPDRADPAEPAGYVCAPSTREPHRHGFLFDRCRIVKGEPAPSAGSYALGRPWHPSFAPDTLNCAVFKDCWMDDHIAARAWTSMDSRPGGVVTTYYPEDARLYETGSTGPGAGQPGPGRFILTDDEAREITAAAVVGGWRPEGLSPGRG